MYLSLMFCDGHCLRMLRVCMYGCDNLSVIPTGVDGWDMFVRALRAVDPG